MRFASQVILTAFIFLVASYSFAEKSSAALNDSLPQCADLIKECFVRADLERANCFFSAAKHPFCEGSALGRLAFKRWSAAPNRPAGFETSPALTGPHLIDQECIANFDNQWSSNLLREDLDRTRLDQLSNQLDSCIKEISDDLRP